MIKVLLSIPRTIIFNLLNLPIKQAIKLPIWLANNVKIYSNKGKIILPKDVSFAMIRIGYHTIHIMDKSSKTIINLQKGSNLIFKGSAHIGQGSKIHVAPNAILELGDNFSISALSSINCYQHIQFGNDIQFSWNCLVMDSDTHKIYNNENVQINNNKPIVFENKIWIGCNTTILKGSHISSNTVIGANSLLCNKHYEGNCIIAGQPAIQTKSIARWEL